MRLGRSTLPASRQVGRALPESPPVCRIDRLAFQIDASAEKIVFSEVCLPCVDPAPAHQTLIQAAMFGAQVALDVPDGWRWDGAGWVAPEAPEEPPTAA